MPRYAVYTLRMALGKVLARLRQKDGYDFRVYTCIYLYISNYI